MLRLEGDPILSRQCEVFDFAEHDADALARRLSRQMRDHDGLGLAAPQIGEPVRAFVIADGISEIACFNPMVAVYSDGQERMQEGCLSYPGVFVYVRRWRGLLARFQNARGDWTDRKLSGAQAHAYQHELDHLDGRTLKDLVPAQTLILAKARAKREKATA